MTIDTIYPQQTAPITDRFEIAKQMADTVEPNLVSEPKSARKDIPGAWLASLTGAERKEVAMSRGLLAYFPDALALVARHSARSNEKHNPGQPLHWSREKSTDHEDCIIRHSAAIAVNPDALDDGQPEIVCRAWRALAALQLWAEAQVAKREPDIGPGWFTWEGRLPLPYGPEQVVEVQLRDGSRGVGQVHTWDWAHSESIGDIVAYRAVTE